MKRFVIVIAIFLLSACSYNGDIKNGLDKLFIDAASENFKVRNNNYSEYIDYYLPSDVYEEDSNKIAFVFNYNKCKFVMNLNIAGIINNKYYTNNLNYDEGFFDSNKLFYSYEGIYKDLDNADNKFIYNVYEYNDKYYCLFSSNSVIIYAYSNKYDIVDLSSRIILITRSADIKNEEIINNYSSKDVVDYQKKQVDLFETVLPVNGRIDDMMLDNKNSDEISE